MGDEQGLAEAGASRLVLAHWNTTGTGIGNVTQIDGQTARSTWLLQAASCSDVVDVGVTSDAGDECARGMLARLLAVNASVLSSGNPGAFEVRASGVVADGDVSRGQLTRSCQDPHVRRGSHECSAGDPHELAVRWTLGEGQLAPTILSRTVDGREIQEPRFAINGINVPFDPFGVED